MKTLLVSFILLFSCLAFSQEEKYAGDFQALSNTERYGIDFEVIDMAIPNTFVLDQINLDAYEDMRLQNMDREIVIDSLNITLLLYSYEKAMINKTNGNIVVTDLGEKEYINSTSFKLISPNSLTIEDFKINTLAQRSDITNIVFDSSNENITFIHTQGLSRQELKELLLNAGFQVENNQEINLLDQNSNEWRKFKK